MHESPAHPPGIHAQTAYVVVEEEPFILGLGCPEPSPEASVVCHGQIKFR